MLEASALCGAHTGLVRIQQGLTICRSDCRLCKGEDPKEQAMLEHVQVWQGVAMDQPRLLCLTYTISTEPDGAVTQIRQTWGQKCDGYMAMSNLTDPSIPAVKIEHAGPEAYDNMWQKVRAIWTHVHRYYADQYDYFLLGGDDLFVIVENLRAYLQSQEIQDATGHGSKPIYLGRPLKHRSFPAVSVCASDDATSPELGSSSLLSRSGSARLDTCTTSS